MERFSTDLIVDILDILIVSYLLYRLFSLMRGTRAVHMFFGLIVLFILSVIAQWVNMIALDWIISSLRTVWVIAFVIIFQPELRIALERIGRGRIWGGRLSVLRTEAKAEATRGSWVSGSMQPAATTRSFWMITAPSWSGLGGVNMVPSSSAETVASTSVPVSA